MKKVRKSTSSKLLACNLENGEMVVAVTTLEDNGCTIKSTGEAFLVCGAGRKMLDKEGLVTAVLRMPEKMVMPDMVMNSARTLGEYEFTEAKAGAENIANLRECMDKADRLRGEKRNVTMPGDMTLDEFLADDKTKTAPRLSVVH